MTRDRSRVVSCDRRADAARALAIDGRMMLDDRFFAAWEPRLRSVLRIVAALLFLEHGTAKILHLPAIPELAGIEPWSLFWVAGIIEIVGSSLLAVGLFSRLAAFVLSGEMAVAYFMFHAPGGFLPIVNAGELPVLYSFAFLYLWAAGPGPWSLDAHLRKRP